MPTLEPPGPVEPTEFVLRRVHLQYYNPSLPTAVMPEAFRPSPEDDRGISLVRELYTSRPEEVLALTRVKPEKWHLYCLARIPVRVFIEQGLPVQADPVPEDPDHPANPGHAIVPGLCLGTYDDRTQKQGLKDKMLVLARAASQDIVYSPPGTPPPSSPIPGGPG